MAFAHAREGMLIILYASVTAQGFLEALLDLQLIFSCRTAVSGRKVFSWSFQLFETCSV